MARKGVKMETLSKRAFGQAVGKSHSWIGKLAAAGKLPCADNGEIIIPAGFEAFDALQGGKKSRQKRGKKANDKPAKQTEAAREAVLKKHEAREESRQAQTSFLEAKRLEKIAAARLKDLEFKTRSGELVEAAAIRSEAQAIALEFRRAHENFPARVCGLLARKDEREIEGILTQEILKMSQTLCKKIEKVCAARKTHGNG